jgi:hypothetical protein
VFRIIEADVARAADAMRVEKAAARGQLRRSATASMDAGFEQRWRAGPSIAARDGGVADQARRDAGSTSLHRARAIDAPRDLRQPTGSAVKAVGGHPRV